MIVYRQWRSGGGKTLSMWDGWFLLGLIPLVIRQTYNVQAPR